MKLYEILTTSIDFGLGTHSVFILWPAGEPLPSGCASTGAKVQLDVICRPVVFDMQGRSAQDPPKSQLEDFAKEYADRRKRRTTFDAFDLGNRGSLCETTRMETWPPAGLELNVVSEILPEQSADTPQRGHSERGRCTGENHGA